MVSPENIENGPLEEENDCELGNQHVFRFHVSFGACLFLEFNKLLSISINLNPPQNPSIQLPKHPKQRAHKGMFSRFSCMLRSNFPCFFCSFHFFLFEDLSVG